MIFVVGTSFSQNRDTANDHWLQQPFNKKTALLMVSKTDKTTLPRIERASINSNFYSNHVGFFCKQEIRLEKKIKIPFKFRLGSVSECDRLEGKGR